MTTEYHYPNLCGYRDLTEDEQRCFCLKHQLKHTGILDIFCIKALEVEGVLCAIIPAWHSAAPMQLKSPAAWAYAPLYGDEINERRLPLLAYSQPSIIGLGQLASEGCSQTILWTAGILDSLRAVSSGSTAVCPTEEKAFWHSGMDRFVKDKTVYVIPNRDEAGERFAQQWGETLNRAGAKQILIARLPYPVQLENGKTLGDYLDDGGDIHLLLDKAAPRRADEKPRADNPPDYRTIVDGTLPQTLAQKFIELSEARYFHFLGHWIKFDQGRYREISVDTLKQDYGALQIRFWKRRLQRGAMVYERIAVTRPRTADALLCLASLPGVAVAEREQTPPFWLEKHLWEPEADELVIVSNGLLHVTSDQIEIMEPTPRLFALRSLPVSYDPAAVCPAWQAAIRKQAGDSGAILQEFMGLALANRGHSRKLLVLFGPDIARQVILDMLSALAGVAYCIRLSLPDLGHKDGLKLLVGKRIIMVEDMTLPTSRLGQQRAVARMADNAEAVVVLCAQRAGQFGPALSRLAHRMVFVPLSFKEESLAEDWAYSIQAELPGVLNWALAGLQRLIGRRTFTRTDAAEQLRNTLCLRLSPMQAFVEECCIVGPREKVRTLDLQEACRRWRRRYGLKDISRKRFREALLTVCPHVCFERAWFTDKTMATAAIGISLADV